MAEIAARIIEWNDGEFAPDEFEDRYETALRELIEARAKGKTWEFAEAPRDTKVVDLLAALKASLGRRKSAPSGGGTVVWRKQTTAAASLDQASMRSRLHVTESFGVTRVVASRNHATYWPFEVEGRGTSWMQNFGASASSSWRPMASSNRN